MSLLSTYDPLKVNVTFNNRQLRMFGDSLFTLARDEANVTLKKGCKGDSTYIINANKAGKLTVTLPGHPLSGTVRRKVCEGEPRHHRRQRQRHRVLRPGLHGREAA